MTARKSVEAKLAEDRRIARRLDKLKVTVTSLGKRGLQDTFAAGEALEEAATLLRGGFTGWVREECGIDPRTALNFRKTFRVLAARKDWLLEKRVAPSVAVTLASAPPEGRERALAEIGAGRRLTAADAKVLVRAAAPRPEKPDAPSLQSLRLALRAFSDGLLGEAGELVAAASAPPADDDALEGLVARARALAPRMAVLARRPGDVVHAEVDELAGAVEALASAAGPDGIRRAAAAFSRSAGLPAAAGADGRPEEAQSPPLPAAGLPATDAPSAIRSVSSVYRHGLTAFELCAGGGGQAAGLAKAGFRHVGLLEREKAPCKTLRAAFGPEHVIEADLVGFEPSDVGPIDLLAGGVPCTPFSKAGKQRGEYDDRDLFPEALRLVKRLRPRAVMLENVSGITGPVHDGYRARIVSRLARLGYRWDWWELDCADFGLPQRRCRAILVAFRDDAAWARFRRLESIGDFAGEPNTMAMAVEPYLRSRGFDPTPELLDRMHRVAPTVIGGSLLKEGSDLGQAKTRKEWQAMGLIGTRWGSTAPRHDHAGDILPTNAMMAVLQGFPFDWPFKGNRRDVDRQIANAFPTPVAFRLGLAIAEALTGDTFDPLDQVFHEAMRWNHVAWRRPRAAGSAVLPPDTASAERRLEIPLAKLRATSSIGEPDGPEGDDHDIDFDRLQARFGPWPNDLWEHQRRHGPL